MRRYLLAIAVSAMACGRYSAGQATVTIAVNGPGAVRTTNLEGDCHATCWFTIDREVPIHLEPVAGPQAVFTGWTGGCRGTGACDLKPAVDVSVAATFIPATPHRLQVSLNGAGEVRSDPSGIDCPRICAYDFPAGTPVTLHPSAAAGWDFTGFDGACVGTICALVIGADAAAVASFIQNAVELSVAVSGEGSVVSTPAAIDCPRVVCSAKFAPGVTLTLTASPASGSRFDGFSGVCTGASCSLRLAASASVSAAFAVIPTFKVSVSTGGSGVGRVTSSPAGIDCPGACAASFPVDTLLTLSPSPDTLSRFVGFGGSCAGAACALKVAADSAVIATFDPRLYTVLDLGVPAGGGWSAPAAISRTGTFVTGTWSAVQQQIFIWDGSMHDSGIPARWVGGVNAAGAVVGAFGGDKPGPAFLWKAGSLTELEGLGGPGSYAAAVNGDGVAVGWATRADGVQRAVAWTPNGIVDLGSLTDNDCSAANGINSSGEIVGYMCTPAAGMRAVRFRGPNVIDDLGSFGGTAVATAINDSGLIVGYSAQPNGAVFGFVYADGKMKATGGIPGMIASRLTAVNNAGIAVGAAMTRSGPDVAVVYASGRMLDVNSVLDAKGYAVTSASGIDDAGTIAATGNSGGLPHALLLCPE